jgi:hypothetical protein
LIPSTTHHSQNICVTFPTRCCDTIGQFHLVQYSSNQDEDDILGMLATRAFQPYENFANYYARYFFKVVELSPCSIPSEQLQPLKISQSHVTSPNEKIFLLPLARTIYSSLHLTILPSCTVARCYPPCRGSSIYSLVSLAPLPLTGLFAFPFMQKQRQKVPSYYHLQYSNSSLSAPSPFQYSPRIYGL